MQKDIFTKAYRFEDAKRAQSLGLYPFFRAIEETDGSTVSTQNQLHPHPMVMIGSNNYLGLTHHPKVKEAAKKAIERFGTGCTGSRFLNGNLVIHEELEERLAHFVGKEAALVFATGFLANAGALSCLAGRRDVIYSDRENHASIVEGQRLALGNTLKFAHNDMDDLERLLMTTRDQYDGAIVVADGIFSMSGEIFDLPKATELCQKYQCRLYIDDAHAIGVLGKKGAGTESHFGLKDSADLIMATFSKSFASVGGMVAGPKDVIDYIKHKSREFIFTAAMPPASVATVLECLNVIENEPWHLENLWKNARVMQTSLNEMGYNTLDSQTPIIPLLVGDDFAAFEFSERLYQRGIFATPVVKPAVPNGQALIRTSYMATHTEKELHYVLDVLHDLGQQMGILKRPVEKQMNYANPLTATTAASSRLNASRLG